ncbi:hypothetical protein ScPMuIL_013087 [Solemya velum]
MAMPIPPCRIGDDTGDIYTPALLIDLDKMETNLDKMAGIMRSYPGVKLRPHAKAHKCAALARMQVSHGAVGVCCQTLAEAETMVNGGIQDVFLSNEIVSDNKLKTFVWSRAREQKGQLAEKIASLPFLLQRSPLYNGIIQHVRSAKEREQAVGSVVSLVKQSIAALSTRGIGCEVVTGGGTGTFQYEAGSGIFNEVQPGSYLIMDVDYSKNLDQDGQFVSDFGQSLYVLTTVISVNDSDAAVVDAGLKALNLNCGMPKVLGQPDMEYENAGDEHGILRPSGGLKVGDQVWLIPSHCDPTVKLYSHMVGVREGRVQSVWPLSV